MEPVFGQIKNKGLIRLLLRGEENCRADGSSTAPATTSASCGRSGDDPPDRNRAFEPPPGSENLHLIKDPDAHVEPLSAGQVQAIPASMPSKHRALVLVGAMTGLRFGDLAGLTVDRVNFIRKVLTVDRQWTADGFGPPKSSTSYRNIPLGEVAVRALADHLGTHPAVEPEGIVFHTGARPFSRKRIHEIWRRPLSK